MSFPQRRQRVPYQIDLRYAEILHHQNFAGSHFPHLPRPQLDLGGVAIEPGRNFPGKGWRGPYAQRPIDLIDLGGKLHDAAYDLNGVDLFTNITGLRPLDMTVDTIRKISRKAKADRMYHLFTGNASYSVSRLVSNDLALFHGRDSNFLSQYISDDGYVDILDTPYLKFLSNPNYSLTIPLKELNLTCDYVGMGDAFDNMALKDYSPHELGRRVGEGLLNEARQVPNCHETLLTITGADFASYPCGFGFQGWLVEKLGEALSKFRRELRLGNSALVVQRRLKKEQQEIRKALRNRTLDFGPKH